MKTTLVPAALCALLLACSGIAAAQPGKGPGNPQAAASAARPGGTGPGAPRRMGPRFGRDFTPGWSMMSRKERDEHRKQMAQARTADECRAARDVHRKLMEERAKQRGIANMPMPRRDACAGFKG